MSPSNGGTSSRTSTGIRRRLERAPDSFEFEAGKQAVFTKFERASYALAIDVRAGTATVSSKITFSCADGGYPLFDLNGGRIQSMTVDGTPVSDPTEARVITSPRTPYRVHATRYRVVPVRVDPGRHQMEIVHALPHKPDSRWGVELDRGAGHAYLDFEMSDSPKPHRAGRTGRGFLERYLPANLEFDQHSSWLSIHVRGTAEPHALFTNGLSVGYRNRWWIRFPDSFTSSSAFLSLAPSRRCTSRRHWVGRPRRLPVALTVFGRDTPVANLERLASEAKARISELQREFGCFPYRRCYLRWGGAHGMEYAGAAQLNTLGSTLEHELVHSYFGRGVMPADGNAGWIDEAIATWWAKGCPEVRHLSRLDEGDMGNGSPYQRATDLRGWSFGYKLIGYFHFKVKAADSIGLVPFLAHLFRGFHGKLVSTAEFEAALRAYYPKLDFSSEFQRFVHGTQRTPLRTLQDKEAIHERSRRTEEGARPLHQESDRRGPPGTPKVL